MVSNSPKKKLRIMLRSVGDCWIGAMESATTHLIYSLQVHTLMLLILV